MDILSNRVESAWECACEKNFVRVDKDYCTECNTHEDQAPDAQLDGALDKALELIQDRPLSQLRGKEQLFIREVLKVLRDAGQRQRDARESEKRGRNILELYRSSNDDLDDWDYIVNAIKDLMHAGRAAGAFPDQLVDAAQEQFRIEDPTL